MPIRKVIIENFKKIKNKFEVELNDRLNILVGNNGVGKSTILEAINVALTGYYDGQSIKRGLSQDLFNKEVVDDYLKSFRNGQQQEPPEIRVTVQGFSAGKQEGSRDTGREIDERIDEWEVKFEIKMNNAYEQEYREFIASGKVLSLPVEFYDVYWSDSSGKQMLPRSSPVKSVMVDSSKFRYYSGSGSYISQASKDLFDERQRALLLQAYRKNMDNIRSEKIITTINQDIQRKQTILNGEISLNVDFCTKDEWESILVTCVDGIPFNLLGKGEQCILKTEIALSKDSSRNLLLLEEPENHLSFSNLGSLVGAIQKKFEGKQIIISTHSSFVANKLGLENLILISSDRQIHMKDLKSADFFRKIPGYDTLRMLLCKRAILVEGPSDELIVQKAYMSEHDGRLPIEDQVDVISVGMAFENFLEIAEKLNCKVAVVTDNDGNPESVMKKYKKYSGSNCIKIYYDPEVDEGGMSGAKNFNYNTLEPKLFKANDRNLALFNEILGKKYENEDDLLKMMCRSKTKVALAVFSTEKPFKFPNYIMKAVKDA